jgi:hypothetical protein
MKIIDITLALLVLPPAPLVPAAWDSAPRQPALLPHRRLCRDMPDRRPRCPERHVDGDPEANDHLPVTQILWLPDTGATAACRGASGGNLGPAALIGGRRSGLPRRSRRRHPPCERALGQDSAKLIA